MKQVIIPYRPTPNQRLIHSDKHRYIVLVCGRRFGKTTLAINKLIVEGLRKPGNYWYAASTYKQAKLIAWEMLKHYAHDLITDKNEQDLMVKIGNSRLFLKGVDNPDSLRGVGVNGMILDEYQDYKDSVFPLILRPMLSDTKGWAMFIGTPKGKRHHFYDKYVEGERDGDYKSYRFTTYDNPYIEKSEIDKAKQELPEDYFNQEYMASFEIYTGAIYKEFSETESVVDEFKLEPWHKTIISIDTGRKTAISFISMQPDEDIVFDEIWSKDDIVKDICRAIKAKLVRYNITSPYFIIDSASQVKEEYKHNGIPVMDCDKDLLNGIARSRALVKQRKLKFYKECTNAIGQMVGYVWDDKSKQDKPKDDDNKHFPDTICYFANLYYPNILKPDDMDMHKRLRELVTAYPVQEQLG